MGDFSEIIAGLIILVGIGAYIHYQNSKEVEKA